MLMTESIVPEQSHCRHGLKEENKVRITQSCAECLYDKQKHLSKDENYLKEIRDIIDHRGEDDTSPYLVYRFQAVYEKYFGRQAPYKDIKKKYNDLVLSMEDSVREKIEAAGEPLIKALMYARVGNYVDFGAMNHVDEETFLSLLDHAKISDKDEVVIQSMISQCAGADEFLLIADNCGEIVLDKLFLEQLQKRFPKLRLSVLVRGGEVLNDATQEDAEYAGITKFARVISNGLPIAGTVYDMLTDEARGAVDRADVILAKGQGNYESLCGQGLHIFYSFLCKCELFTGRFEVPKFTGIFVEENALAAGHQ